MKSEWDESGQGKNILSLLTLKEAKIWEAAFSFQDKRGDEGHAEIVVYFALELLKSVGANRNIVVPAAILHDIGWSALDKTILDNFKASAEVQKNQEYRYQHEKEGCKIAKKILKNLKYNDESIHKILEIIDGHDTRKGFLNPEDGVVRDADKLWRFVSLSWKRYSLKPETHQRMHEDLIQNPSFFYSDAARKIAKIELGQTIDILRQPKG